MMGRESRLKLSCFILCHNENKTIQHQEEVCTLETVHETFRRYISQSGT